MLDKNGNAIAVSDERKTESEKSEESLEYLQTSLKQVILGNYTDDTNLIGTLGQLLLGLLGFDLPADVRDFAYDVTNFEMSPGHILQTLIDALAFVPVVGAFKYTDETVDVLKSAAKYGDEAAEVSETIKHIDDIPNYKNPKLQKSNITEQIKSNLGKSINVLPSKKHYVAKKNPGYKGIPDSSIDIVDETGEIVTRRWYDAQGNAYRDVDFTNHGNSATHPEWPHEHIWRYNKEGKPIGR